MNGNVKFPFTFEVGSHVGQVLRAESLGRSLDKFPEHVLRPRSARGIVLLPPCAFLTAGVGLFLLVILLNRCGGGEGRLTSSRSSFQTVCQEAGSSKWPGCLFPRWHPQRDLLNEAVGSLLSDLYIPDLGQDVSSGKYGSFVFE